MKLHEITKLEKELTRQEIEEFDKALIDINKDIHANRNYDRDFIYSPFNEMNPRNYVYMGYLMGLKKNGR
jgi:hypothetical protein